MEQARQRIREEYREKYDEALETARRQAQDAEALLVQYRSAYLALLDQLLPIGKTRNLGRHVAFRELDLDVHNAVL
jgi:hypothetical protein